ncbi:MAG: four helix bundle protein [Desulfobulbaceae bacterium]|uniref:Four helix bundle protein n=1 Tax=Candidatus Desulfobia pelagia TaxID=2841692 RepID=A0A8J6TFY5_9BACT|nr:four helix bundle protein [Candidatus Desulfobia pelagia]
MSANYKDLIVWQRAMQLSQKSYEVTREFPADEKFGLVSQIRRASVSVVSNIAEGQGRMTKGEFRQFLGHARGSLFELETQVLLAEQLGFVVRAKDVNAICEMVEEVKKMLNGLIKSLA